MPPIIRGMDGKRQMYTISEAARELGLSSEWLRQGEKRGSLPPARRDRNGYRYYTAEDVELLRNRRLLRRGERQGAPHLLARTLRQGGSGRDLQPLPPHPRPTAQ